jgi:hypothetical protein
MRPTKSITIAATAMALILAPMVVGAQMGPGGGMGPGGRSGMGWGDMFQMQGMMQQMQGMTDGGAPSASPPPEKK